MASGAPLLAKAGLTMFTLVMTVLPLLLGTFLDPCGLVNVPDLGGAVSHKQCWDYLKAGARHAASSGNGDAGVFLMFMFTVVARVEAAAFISLAAVSAFTLLATPFHEQYLGLLVAALFSTLVAVVDASNAGLIRLGAPNPLVSAKAAAFSGGPILAVWTICAATLWPAFVMSLRAGRAAAKPKTK